MLNVRKFPDQYTLAECVFCNPEDTIPAGWERMSEAEYDDWSRQQVANGWRAAEYVAPPQVPQVVRAAQLRQWLVDADLADSVEALFANPGAWPDEKSRKKAQARWEYEVNIHRDDPMLVNLSQALGLTSEQVDAAFFAANEIP